MGFGQTVGEQRLLDTLTRNLPRIVTLLDHVAKSVDENNRLLNAHRTYVAGMSKKGEENKELI